MPYVTEYKTRSYTRSLHTMAAAKQLAIRLETVDALVAKFRERWDCAEDDIQMIEDFKASLGEMKAPKAKKVPKEGDAPKKKRNPSPYNLFVSEKKAEIIAAGFKGQDMIREAARMWKALHDAKETDDAPADEE